MIQYLGKIGNNQYQKIPNKVSLKKSYPLPRDIMVRTLGKMAPSILPVLFTSLTSNDLSKVVEVIDSIGFLVFYHQELANLPNLTTILTTLDKYYDNNLIVWKITTCLSAFPLSQSIDTLNKIKQSSLQPTIVDEASRSLNLITKANIMI